MDVLFYDNPLLGVQFRTKEDMEKAVMQKGDLQDLDAYKYHWFGKHKKQVRTISYNAITYHMVDDFYKITKKPERIPKCIGGNRKNNRVEKDGKRLIIYVGNVKLIVAVTQSRLQLVCSMGEASYSFRMDMNGLPKYWEQDSEAYVQYSDIYYCHGFTCFIISKPVNYGFSKEMTDYFECFMKKNLSVLIELLTYDAKKPWTEYAQDCFGFDFGFCHVPTKEVLDYEQAYSDTVVKKRKMLGLRPNIRQKIGENFYCSNTSKTVGSYNLCGEYHVCEEITLNQQDSLYEIPTYVTNITDVQCGHQKEAAIKGKDYVFRKKAGSKNKLSINFSENLCKINEHNRQWHEEIYGSYDTMYKPAYPLLELLEVNSMTLKVDDKMVTIEDNGFRCVKAREIDFSQVWGLKEITGKHIFNVEHIGTIKLSKDVQITRDAFVVEDTEMINPEFSPEEKAEESRRRKQKADAMIDAFIETRIVRA